MRLKLVVETATLDERTTCVGAVRLSEAFDVDTLEPRGIVVPAVKLSEVVDALELVSRATVVCAETFNEAVETTTEVPNGICPAPDVIIKVAVLDCAELVSSGIVV